MKKILLLLVVAMFGLSSVPHAFADEYVHSYYRSNGTYVQGYYRSSPDGNPYNNYSFPGNTNPYTGVTASGNPDTYLQDHYGYGSSYTPYSSYSGTSYTPTYTPTYDSSYIDSLMREYHLGTYSRTYVSHGYRSYGFLSCNSGYHPNGSATDNSSICEKDPVNGYSIGSDIYCDSGYQKLGNQCIAINKWCKNKYGSYAGGSGSSCYCVAGSQWVSTSQRCVPVNNTNSTVSNSNTASSFLECSKYGVGAQKIGKLCYCKSGYEWNSSLTSCVAGYPNFTQYLLEGSSGQQVVNLKNFLATQGLYSGYVNTPFDSSTKKALSLYQEKNNIPRTGTAGPITRTSLNHSVLSSTN